MIASGESPFSASAAAHRASAAAPSEIELEMAAVTVPSFLRRFEARNFSGLALPGCSSLSMTDSPLRPLTVTGAISQLNEPSLFAANARDSDRMANSSCASRLNWNLSAHCAAKTPMSLTLS
jgi:hypothetical protein